MLFIHTKEEAQLQQESPSREEDVAVSQCLAHASLFAAVVSGHHQVAVGTQLSDVGRLAAAAVDRRRLAFHPRELQHAAGVVL